MARSLSAEAREKTLSAAVELLAADGLDGFTVDAVAKRSGVAKTTIYRHFSSGNELLIRALDCTIQPFPTPNTGSLRTDIEELIESIMPLVEDHTKQKTMLSIIAAAAADSGLARIHEELMTQRTTPIKTILELAQARGEIRADLDLELALDFVESPFFFRKMVRRQPLTKEEIRELAALVTAGLENV